MAAELDFPDIRDDPRWVRCAVYTRQSVTRPGDDPAVSSCAIQRDLCTEFIRSKTWNFWYPVAERFDDEGESGSTLERSTTGTTTMPWHSFAAFAGPSGTAGGS